MTTKPIQTIIENSQKKISLNLPTKEKTKALKRKIDLKEKNVVKYIHYYHDHISTHKTFSKSDYENWLSYFD